MKGELNEKKSEETTLDTLRGLSVN